MTNSIFRSLRLPGMIICLVVLFVSCSRKADEVIIVKSKPAIQQLIDAGSLLNSITKNGNSYILKFETGEISIPSDEIKTVVSETALWKTVLTFIDNTTLAIPSKGGPMDFMVKEIQLNPSGLNPLAALVNVILPTYGRVKVTVHGKNGINGNITHLCSGETVNQMVPVFGLYADYENIVDLTFTDLKGNERGTTQIKIRTQPLPVQDFPIIKVTKNLIQKMEPGVNLVSYPGASELDVSIPYMVDNEGAVRWVLLLKSSAELQKLSMSIGLKRTSKGTFICGDQVQNRIVEIDMFGNLIRQWDLMKWGYRFHHEVAIAKNNNFLITVTNSAARLLNGNPRVNDFIVEMDPVSSTLVKEWDLSKMIDTARYVKPDGITPPQFSQSPTNWAHNNSIVEMADNNLIATCRYQGIISYTRNGNLKWIISPHKYWGAKYQPYLLNPIDEQGNPVTDPNIINGDASSTGFDWPWGPHTPVILPNNNILVFDNGYNRNWISNALTDNNYSRVVEYKVYEANKTVQQVWSFGKEMGKEGFAQAVSGVQFLSQTHNVLFCPGMAVPTSNGLGGKVVELNLITKERVFEMEITAPSNSAFHRVTRMSLYPDNL